MTLGATLGRSFLAVLARPSTWPLALVGFLLRGGWLLVVAPVVVVPTPVGLANVVAPFIEDVAFGRRTGEVIAISVVAVVLVLGLLIGGGLLAAITEAEGVRRVAEEEDIERAGDGGAGRVLAARLLALVPLAAGLAWAVVRIIGVAYRELAVPSDVTVPIAWRIVSGAPEAFAIVGLTFLFSEIVGAVASRRVVLAGQRAWPALRAGEQRLRTHVGRMLAIAIATNAALLAVVLVTGLAATATWGALGASLALTDPPLLTTLLLVAFVALFLGGLVLLGLVCAWRAAVWTLDVGGTFGGGTRTRSSD